jgi:hypothetical protein
MSGNADAVNRISNTLAVARALVMTQSDIQFFRAIGIEPCDLDDRIPISHPSPLPPEVLVPFLTEKDTHWLGKLKVIWKED